MQVITRDGIRIPHPDGDVWIEELTNGRKRVTVCIHDASGYVPKNTWETRYSLDLIERVLELRGPSWICDDLRRDEDPEYLLSILSQGILKFVDETEFANKRLLDFGCGSGASTAVLARMFPDTEIIGIDLSEELLDVAKARIAFYGFSNVVFLRSPCEQELPSGIGTFDFISLSAVVEHLFPDERRTLIPALWAILRPSGVLFINQTPHRYFVIERHTTGLPLLNYLPDQLALVTARRFSRRVHRDESWEQLLRKGIRGATQRSIMRSLGPEARRTAFVLPPRNAPGPHSAVRTSRSRQVKRGAYRVIGKITGSPYGPWVRLAIQKRA